MLAYYADEHVHSGIVEGLRLRGIDVLTVQEDFREGSPDPENVDRATELGRIMLTADADYLAEGVRRQRVGIEFSGIVRYDFAVTGVGQCIEEAELIAKVFDDNDTKNQITYIPLR